MKIALLTDTHFGARSDSLRFDENFQKFYDDVFFPYLDEHNIKRVIHLGDVFDRRKYVNFQILNSCKEYFLEPLRERGVEMDVFAGNHDTYFKNTNAVNSLNLLLKGYENISIHDSPTAIALPTYNSYRKAIMVPWICNENFDETMKALDETDAELCFGHFEIAGFEMHKGMGAESGFDPDVFKKFKQVYTGHFHHKSSKGNIHYLGSPYQMTWNDYDDVRGFHILDTETLEMTFIANEHVMYHKIHYDDTKFMDLDAARYAGTCVKIIVVNKKDFLRFDKFVDDLYLNGVYELKILEDFSEFEFTEDEGEDVSVEDTLTLLSEQVDLLDSPVEKDKLRTVLKTLFIEAQNLET